MLSTSVLSVQCHYCSQWKNPGEVLLIGESIRMCQGCAAKHDREIALMDAAPEECAMCHRKTADIAAEATGDTFTMCPVWVDGSYQLICECCRDSYIPKRRDLFKDSRYAKEQNL